MAYDIDGTAVGYNTQSYNVGATTWLNSTQLGNLNKDVPVNALSGGKSYYLFFFFPERREISYFYFSGVYVRTVLLLSYRCRGVMIQQMGLTGLGKVLHFLKGHRWWLVQLVRHGGLA
jgi:hypothetical protein